MTKKEKWRHQLFLYLKLYMHKSSQLLSILFLIQILYYFWGPRILILASIVHLAAQDLTEPATFDEVIDVCVYARGAGLSTPMSKTDHKKDNTLADTILSVPTSNLLIINRLQKLKNYVRPMQKLSRHLGIILFLFPLTPWSGLQPNN